MQIKPSPLEIISSEMIPLPKQKISRKPCWNFLALSTISAFESFLGVNHSLRVHQVKFKSPIETGIRENDTGTFRHYTSKGKSAVIVLPQRGSGYNAAQLIASYLASNGIDAYELETPLRGSRLPSGITSMCNLPVKFSDIEKVFSQAVTEVACLARFIKQERIGVCGVSLGAIYSSIVYCLEPRLESACLLLCGGDLPEMVRESDDRLARHMKACLSEDEIARLVEIDPCSYVDSEKASNLLMINALLDRDIPEKYGEALKKAWGNPQQYLISATHAGIAKHATKILPRILQHFSETLAD